MLRNSSQCLGNDLRLCYYILLSILALLAFLMGAILQKNIRDFLEPINIFAKHEFVYNSTLNRFCKCCPTEKKYNRLNTAQILLPFNIDCGTDRVCNSNISVTAKFQGVR